MQEISDIFRGCGCMKQLTLFGNSLDDSLKNKKESEQMLKELVGIFTRPKIVMPGYTDMPIPDNIKSRIFIERLILAKDREKTATDTEAMWYLSTASLTMPLGHHWNNIFFYLTRKFMLKEGKKPLDFLEDEIKLDDFEKQELTKLKEWIYRKSADK